jgi:hypothetical protein
MIRKLFIYWHQGFEDAPLIVKKCLLSWKTKNPTWEIIELDFTNLHKYININYNSNIALKFPLVAYSNLIRVFLLEKYGGVWADATTFCNISLDEWLNKNIKSGFFCFYRSTIQCELSSWFLYAEKNNYIIKILKQKSIDYWKTHDKSHTFHWFQSIFDDMLKQDKKFKNIWNETPKISALIRNGSVKKHGRQDGPHFFYPYYKFYYRKLKETREHIDNKKTPLYKLTYNINMEKYNKLKNCDLKYLFNTLQ